MAWSHEIKGDLATFTVRGPYTLEEAKAAFTSLLEDPALRPGMALLVDGTRVVSNPSADEMEDGASFAASVKPPFGKIAVAVPEGVQFGLARMFAAYAELRADLDIHVFDRLADAREWLSGGFE